MINDLQWQLGYWAKTNGVYQDVKQDYRKYGILIPDPIIDDAMKCVFDWRKYYGKDREGLISRLEMIINQFDDNPNNSFKFKNFRTIKNI